MGPGEAARMGGSGRYSRPVDEWRALCDGHFTPTVVEPYSLKGLGVSLWRMVYVKGRPKC